MDRPGILDRMTKPIPYVDAAALVHADVQASYPDISEAEAIQHVWNTIRLPEERPTLGAVALDEDGTELARAYRVVLMASPWYRPRHD